MVESVTGLNLGMRKYVIIFCLPSPPFGFRVFTHLRSPENTREHSGNTAITAVYFQSFHWSNIRSHDQDLTIFGIQFFVFSSFPANGLVRVATTNVRLEFRVHVLFRRIYRLNVVNLVPSTLEYAFLGRILDMGRSRKNLIELLVCVCIALDFAQTIGERISIILLW